MNFKRVTLAILLVGFVVSEANAQFNRHRRRGTIIGGVAGAAIGAAIGDRSDNEAVGAVIGGVTGAAIGGNIGANKDYRIENGTRYYSGHRYTYPQPVYTPTPVVVTPAAPVVPAPVVSAPVAQTPAPLSQHDVVAMLRNGISEQTVASQIQQRGLSHSLTVNDIIRLHQTGVSEPLIQLMQAHAVSSMTSPVPPTAPYYGPQSHVPQTMTPQHTHSTHQSTSTHQSFAPPHQTAVPTATVPSQSPASTHVSPGQNVYGESILVPPAN